MHVSNSAVASTSRDLSRLESTTAKLRKSSSRSRADHVVAYSTRLRLGLAPARLRLQVGFKPEPRKHYRCDGSALHNAWWVAHLQYDGISMLSSSRNITTLGGFSSICMQPMCHMRPMDVHCHHRTPCRMHLHLHALRVPRPLGRGHAVGAVHAWGRVSPCWTLLVGHIQVACPGMWHRVTPGGLCHGMQGWHGGSLWMALGLIVGQRPCGRGGHDGQCHPCDMRRVTGVLAPGLFGLASSVRWAHACGRTCHTDTQCDAWSVRGARKRI